MEHVMYSVWILLLNAHLSRRLDTFPNAEVAHDPNNGQAQRQFPADGTQPV